MTNAFLWVVSVLFSRKTIFKAISLVGKQLNISLLVERTLEQLFMDLFLYTKHDLKKNQLEFLLALNQDLNLQSSEKKQKILICYGKGHRSPTQLRVKFGKPPLCRVQILLISQRTRQFQNFFSFFGTGQFLNHTLKHYSNHLFSIFFEIKRYDNFTPADLLGFIIINLLHCIMSMCNLDCNINCNNPILESLIKPNLIQ